MRLPLRLAVLLTILAASPVATGCAQRAVLFVDLLGDSTGLTIETVRVNLFSVRLGRAIDIVWQPVEPATSIDLPSSLVANVRGDVEDGDEVLVTVFAQDNGGAALLEGSVTVILFLGEVTETSVTLLPPGTCGDGVANPTEDCDGNDLAGETCGSQGWASGSLACATDCTFDTAACVPLTCGDDIVDAGEECDGADLDGMDCASAGTFSGGTLTCSPICVLDTSGCNGPPTIPALRKPMNNSYMGSVFVAGSLRPEFVWEASTVAGGPSITYQLEYSTDALFDPLQTTTIMTAFTSNQPAADLVISPVPPVGARYYWRVRACAGSACSDFSDVWWVNVGRWDRDFNGDGYADIAVGAYLNDAGGVDAGRFYVMFGGPGMLDGNADGFVTGTTPGAYLGASVASAGDLNGDGFADLLVGAQFAGAGEVRLYLGEDGSAFDTVADATFTGEVIGDEFGVSVTSAGDVNADGFDDFVVGAWKNDVDGMDAGRAYLYLGNAGTPDTVPDAIFLPEAPGDWLGRAVAGAGDINGDGFADVAVAGPRNDAAGTDAGRAYVYLGSPGIVFDTTADVTLPGQAVEQYLGLSLATAGDPNGDGFADILVRGPGPPGSVSQVFLFLGNASAMLGPLPDATFSGTAPGDGFGGGLADGRDVNGDDVDDLVIGAPQESTAGMFAGATFVFLGTAGAPPDATPDGILSGGGAGAFFGNSVAAAGDVDGDGLGDVLVGAPYAAAGDGQFFFFSGVTGPSFDVGVDAMVSGASGEALGIAVTSQPRSETRYAEPTLPTIRRRSRLLRRSRYTDT